MRRTYAFSSSKCARLMVFRFTTAPDLWFLESQLRWTYAFSSPKCAGLMLFRVPNAPDLCFFESQMRRTYAFSTPKCAGLMLFRVPNAPDLCFFESQMRWTYALEVISFRFCGVPGKDVHPGKERLRNTSRLGVLRAFLGVNRLYPARWATWKEWSFSRWAWSTR